MESWRIPLSDLDLGEAEEEAVVRVVRSRWLTLGGEVAAFEREFAEHHGAENAVALSSCTAALHLACIALGVGAGAEVIVPTMTFVATANAVALAGGRPVFADSIGPDDFSLDPSDVERRITPDTRGIICVHYGGFPCFMDELLELCERYELFLIEDAAHAPGVASQWGMLGTIGDVGCFSFFGNKNMTTGEGGMAIARDPRVGERIRLLRSHGMTTTSWERYRGRAFDYDVVESGLNYRPTELAAAIGRAQLARLTENNRRRNLLLDRYRGRLDPGAGIEMPYAGRAGAAHLAVALLRDRKARDELRAVLATEGIQSSLHYPPVHLFEHFRSTCGTRLGDFPVAEGLAARAVTLPLYSTMTHHQVDEVCDSALSAVRGSVAAGT